MAIVGDFDPAENLKILARRLRAGRRSSRIARIPADAVSRRAGGSTQQILTPDKANAVYVAGMAFPMKDTDADYPAL